MTQQLRYLYCFTKKCYAWIWKKKSKEM